MDLSIDIESGIAHVKLSERNLRILLAKLEGFPPRSKMTMLREVADDWTLIVTAEPDPIHYSERSPGPMNPDSEAAILGRRRRGEAY